MDFTVAFTVSRTTYCIYFIKENDACFLSTSKLEKLSYHSRSFTNVPLNKLTSNYSNETCISSVRHSSCAKGLSCSWRTIQQDTLGWINSKLCKPLRMKQGHFYNFTNLINLLLAATKIIVSHIRLVLNCHHRHRWVNLWRQWQLDRNFGADFARSLATDPHTFLDISWRKLFVETNNELALVFEVDYVFCFISTWINNLSASSYLKWGLFFHQVFVSWNIPLDRKSKTGITFFNSTSILDFLVKFFYFIFAFLQLVSVRSLSVSFEEFDVLLT